MSRHFCDSFFKGTQYGWGLNLGSRWVDGEVPDTGARASRAWSRVAAASAARDPCVTRRSRWSERDCVVYYYGRRISAGGPSEKGIVLCTRSAGFLGAVYDGKNLSSVMEKIAVKKERAPTLRRKETQRDACGGCSTCDGCNWKWHTRSTLIGFRGRRLTGPRAAPSRCCARPRCS